MNMILNVHVWYGFEWFGISVADWIVAIAALIGTFFAIKGYYRLISDDKNQQEQINKLTSIAGNLEAQNEILKKSNDLLSEQIDVLRNSAVLVKQDNEGAKKLAEIQEKKLKLSVRPYFKSHGMGWSPQDVHFKIDNFGERASITSVQDLGNKKLSFSGLRFPIIVEKGQPFKIQSFIQGVGAQDLEYKIEFIYKDSLNNSYRQILSGRGGQIDLTEPEEII